MLNKTSFEDKFLNITKFLTVLYTLYNLLKNIHYILKIDKFNIKHL